MFEPQEQENGQRNKAPDQIEKFFGPADDPAEQPGTADAENAIGAAGNAEHVVNESDADDFADADGDDQQVIAAQMDDGSRHRQREQPGSQPAQRQGPQNRNLIASVEDGGGIGPHRVERGVAHVEQPGLAQDQVEAQRQQRVQADAVEHIHLIGVEKQRRKRQQTDNQSNKEWLETVHTLGLSLLDLVRHPLAQ